MNHTPDWLVSHNLLVIDAGAHFGIERFVIFRFLRGRIADGVKRTELGEIAHQILAPVATTNNRDIFAYYLFPQPRYVVTL